jgi:hypothetical protein
MTGAHNTRRLKPRERVNLNVSADAVSELQMEAGLRDVGFATLCSRLLEIMAEDSDLIDNILDGEMKRVKGSV